MDQRLTEEEILEIQDIPEFEGVDADTLQEAAEDSQWRYALCEYQSILDEAASLTDMIRENPTPYLRDVDRVRR